MLDPAMLLEIEDRAPEVIAEFEIQIGGDDLVLLAQGPSGDLPGRGDNGRAADHRKTVLGTAFSRRQYPSCVLIGSGLQRQEMVKHPQMLGLAMVDVFNRRVVAEGHDLDPLPPPA